MKSLSLFFVYGLLTLKMMMVRTGDLAQYSPLQYDSKTYYIHKDMYTTYPAALGKCRAGGGLLAEINDEAEFRAIQNYLDEEVNDKTAIIMIGGTDKNKDGVWHLPSTGEILPYENWLLPDYYRDNDPPEDQCLSLIWYDWFMYTYPCKENPPMSNKRFLCETDNVKHVHSSSKQV